MKTTTHDGNRLDGHMPAHGGLLACCRERKEEIKKMSHLIVGTHQQVQQVGKIMRGEK
jgi:hypothetical protein